MNFNRSISSETALKNFPTLPLAIFVALTTNTWAQDVSGPTQESSEIAITAETPEQQAEAIVARLRPSLVTIRVQGRDGDQLGMGTGFVIDPTGLIATNLHVIMEGRPFTVETSDKQQLKVISVEASDRNNDLALIRIDPQAKELSALQLAPAESIAQGATVLALGNPLGMQYSVVRGIVSAIRDVDNRTMIQVAMPIEFGNSGGPLVDLLGRVHGIINMKSAIEDRIGFAIPIQRLHELQSTPNPVVIDRWVRLGRMNADQWQPLMGADWQQHSGMIQVRGTGKGFGGRSLCLAASEVPDKPFEVAVNLRLHDESGAAGLVFHSDSKDRHYGFYPSNGNLRLSCFQGPSVFTWQVLHEVKSTYYLPGEWNQLKVRIDVDGIKCFVNGQLVVESSDTQLTSGSCGLATFRSTNADFRQFRVGQPSQSEHLSAAAKDWFAGAVDHPERLQRVSLDDLELLAGSSEASVQEFTRRAAAMESQAKRMRTLAEDLRRVPVLRQIRDLLTETNDDDLVRGALLIASLDNPDLDIDAYVARIDQMVTEIREDLSADADANARLNQLDQYLFEENGFHGGRNEYYHAANSHLNRVIDDREGLPITMAILYMELGRRLDLNIEGVGLPGHFVVRHVVESGDDQLIDVFERANRLTKADATRVVLQYARRMIDDSDLRPQSTEEILTRVLRNLIGSAGRERDPESILRYIEALVALNPQQGEFRMMRAAARHQTDRDHAAIEDLDWLLEKQPPGINVHEVQQMRDFLEPGTTTANQ